GQHSPLHSPCVVLSPSRGPPARRPPFPVTSTTTMSPPFRRTTIWPGVTLAAGGPAASRRIVLEDPTNFQVKHTLANRIAAEGSPSEQRLVIGHHDVRGVRADALAAPGGDGPGGVQPGVERRPEARELVQRRPPPVEGRGDRPQDERHREEDQRARYDERPEQRREQTPRQHGAERLAGG